MQIIEAVVLGLVQGSTEFLPVSSSGHLVLMQHLLGFSESMLVFDVFLHLATLLAVIVFFWQDILKLNRRDIKMLAIGTLPAIGVGLLLTNLMSELFQLPILVGCALLGTGVINLRSHQQLKANINRQPSITNSPTNNMIAFKIGLWQAAAILPGISRSGSTVYAGLKMGLDRQAAFRFSFLLSIPAIIAANVHQSWQTYQSATISVQWLPTMLAMAVAFITGLLCLRLLQYLIQAAKFKIFSWYCFALGGLVIAISMVSW